MAQHIYRMSEWETLGRWYVNDVEGGGSSASRWWVPMRMLGISIEEYITLLHRFKASQFKYTVDTNVLIFSFNSQADARKFKNWMNAEARKRQFLCGE